MKDHKLLKKKRRDRKILFRYLKHRTKNPTCIDTITIVTNVFKYMSQYVIFSICTEHDKQTNYGYM